MKFLKPRKRRGSSLVYLGLSVIAFIVSYGITFTIVPMVLGSFFTMMPPVMNATWAATYAKEQSVLQYLIPLVPALGIFMLVIKVLMVSSVKGRD